MPALDSLRNSLRSLSPQQVQTLLASLSESEAEALLHDWPLWARAEQLAPTGDWNVWLILAGRGWGKTRTGAEDVAAYGMATPARRIAVVAPTYADARDTCIEGESGLLGVLPKHAVRTWNRSLGELVLRNNTRYKIFSATEPDRLRGPQHHRAWCDELAAWRKLDETWDMLMFGLRLGARPQAVVTTTPRPRRLLRALLARPDVRVTRGSTFDNAAHLAPAALAQLRERYEGTRLGRQELDAEILTEVPGALWTYELLDRQRIAPADVPPLRRVAVGVDPAISSGDESDETGIVVAGVGDDGRGYVLADASLRGTPLEWARAVVAAYTTFAADAVYAEANQGGEMVEQTLRTVAPNLPIHLVHASRGKHTRAEPIAALYEQGRISHAGNFPWLVEQMTSWTPEAPRSPDRMDALVWVLTALLVDVRPTPRVWSPWAAAPL